MLTIDLVGKDSERVWIKQGEYYLKTVLQKGRVSSEEFLTVFCPVTTCQRTPYDLRKMG